jgi:tetratricopeptide (TPR) repeat protein
MHASADSRSGGAPGRAWRARAVFLSSTFADMHAERDYLRLHAFAELEERLRERCHDLEVIDLRQGVETAAERDESRREARVLQVCLDEIARARPYFVCLLGDRYGWVPPEVRTSAAAREAGLDAAVDGLSVTELEVLHGVLADPERRGRAWFYLRECDYEGMPAAMRTRFDDRVATDPDAAVRVRRLEALKARLRRELPDRVRTYHVRWDAARGDLAGLDALARRVRDDLWTDLDADTRDHLREAAVTWQGAAEQALEDFVAGRTRLYVDRPAVTGPLLDHLLAPAAGAPWGLCVTGEPGSGKSTVFSRLYAGICGRPDVVLLAHAAGIEPQAGSVEAMLRRWAGQLAAALGETDPFGGLEPDAPGGATGHGTDQDTDARFASLLHRVAETRRVVVLVDALDQFEATTRARYLSWLPRIWPANARLLATAIPGTASEAMLARAGVRGSSFAPLSREEARAIAGRCFRDRYHREPNAPALEVLLDARLPAGVPAHGNPLWLDLALQEMNLLEADDYARADREFGHLSGADRMQALLCQVAGALPPDVPGVYGWLLDRAERGFGPAWTRAVLGLIAAGRAGWRERDLRAVVPEVCRQPWDELAFAGVRRTLGAHLVQRGASAQWDVFHTGLRQAVLARMPSPIERHLLHGLLAVHLMQLMLDAPGDPLARSELLVHLIAKGDQLAVARHLAWRYQRFERLPELEHELSEAVARLAEWVRDDETLEGLEARAHWVASLATSVRTDFDAWLAVVRAIVFHLDRVLESGGGPAATIARLRMLEGLREVLSAFLSDTGTTPVQQVHAGRELASLLHRLGDGYMAREHAGDLDRAGEASEAALAIDTQLAQRFGDDLGLRDLSVSLEKCGSFHLRRARAGDLDRAMEYFERSREIRERRANSRPDDGEAQRDLSVALHKLADVHRWRSDYERVRALQEEVLARDERRAAASPDDLEALDDLSRSLGDLAGALSRDVPDDADRAVAMTQRALGIGRDLVERRPDHAEWVRALGIKLKSAGDAFLDRRREGDAARARALYEEALAVEGRRAAANPADLDAVRGQGIALTRLGDLALRAAAVESAEGERAWAAYCEAFGHFRALAAANPSDAQACRDLLISHGKLILAAQQTARDAEAEAHQHTAHQLLRRMQGQGLWLEPGLDWLLTLLDRAAAGDTPGPIPPLQLSRLRAALGLEEM